MQVRRRVWPGVWPGVLAVALVACGPPTLSASEGSSEGGASSESGHESSESGVAEETSEPEPETETGDPDPGLPCEAIDNDPELACAGPLCPVVRDLELRCPEDAYLAYGRLETATGPDASWVFIGTFDDDAQELDHHMVELGEGMASFVDTSPLAPLPLTEVYSSVDPQGTLHILEYEEVQLDAPTVVTDWRWESSQFVPEAVPNDLWLARSAGFEFDDAGGVHAVHCHAGCNIGSDSVYMHRPPGEDWVEEPLDYANPFGFGLTIAGELFAYITRTEDPDLPSYEALAVVANSEEIIASGLAAWPAFFPISKPTPATDVAVGPLCAAVTQTSAGLRIATPAGLLPAIARTAPIEIDCPTSYAPPCDQTCEVVGLGLPDQSFAGVRAADGRTFLVWTEHDWDMRWDYFERRGTCYPELAHDDSITTLHVDLVDFDAMEVLVPGWSIAVRRSKSTGTDDLFGHLGRQIDVSAWGQRITVAIAEGGTNLDPDRSVHVFELDAELLP